MLMGAASMSREETGGEGVAAERSTNMHRVKLYKLNSQGLWDDKGTGHVALEYLPVRSRPVACSGRSNLDINCSLLQFKAVFVMLTAAGYDLLVLCPFCSAVLTCAVSATASESLPCAIHARGPWFELKTASHRYRYAS